MPPAALASALAQRFAEAQMQVVLADIEEDALKRAVEKLEARQARVLGVSVNTMLESSVQALAEAAIAEFGTVHVLCNNAGVASTAIRTTPIWEIPQADWDWVMGVNFNGVLFGLRAFLPHMLSHGEEGHVVNTASLAGLMPGGGTYGVSKHGVLALTETLYNDLHARGSVIGSSVLCPGFVNTQIFDAERNRPAEQRVTSRAAASEVVQQARAMLATGKPPEEIAQAVFTAIKEERLYVLPHPAWDDFVLERTKKVLARGVPAEMDFADMMRRREAGEQF